MILIAFRLTGGSEDRCFEGIEVDNEIVYGDLKAEKARLLAQSEVQKLRNLMQETDSNNKTELINLSMIDVDPSILNSSFDIAYLNTFFAEWNLQKNLYRAREAMNNVPALKNNPNVNRATFDRYFKRLEKALTTF